ncbi:MAG: hypothetical protein Ct9H300mP8_03920 [Gammaproteobacteria bacterium]|nr:MAG: hypothetical protein Ct9H300mP8_03920 [Gammaproteobacteria bacterium]
MEPIEKNLSIRGINVTYYEWGDRAGDDVLFIHATGFHARCWDATIRELGEPITVWLWICEAMVVRIMWSYEWSTFGADCCFTRQG